ncbi:MAG: hypothetical protein LBG81_02790 [Coriobacteriaceae bacterium]|nr:hypothetical protein [Coriobacteriaceae bacterium]
MNRMFVLALAIGLLLAALQVMSVVVPFAFSDVWAPVRNGMKGVWPHSFYSSWIGVTGYSVFSTLYYFMLPLLVCLPHASSLYADLKAGYTGNVHTRVKASYYYFAKMTAVFLSAGAVSVVPLVANLLATMLFLPLVLPDPVAGIFFSGARMWLDVYYSSPNLYIVLYLLLTFFVSGIIAWCAVSFGFLVSNGFMVLVAPFVCCVFLSFVGGASLLTRYAPISLLSPYAGNATQILWVIVFYAFLGTLFCLFTGWQVHRQEAALWRNS